MRASPQELLQVAGHRPWPCPPSGWRYYQEWNQVLFLHWPVEASSLQGHLPSCLEVDLLHQQAWISVVVFRMEKSRLRGLPSWSPLSDFHEVNVRTYVRHQGKPGVYFLSIEADKWLSCQIARRLSGLPYQKAAMQRSDRTFRSHNPATHHALSLEFSLGKAISDKSDQDLWLTERYALFQDVRGGLNAYDVHHPEWSLQELTLDHFSWNCPALEQLVQGPPACVHASDGVQVLAWGKEKYSCP